MNFRTKIFVKDKEKKQVFTASLPFGFYLPNDDVSRKLLKEYGAVFVARGGVIPPDKVVFQNEEEVAVWQKQVPQTKAYIGGIEIELQTAAMNSLKDAVVEAKKSDLTITPRGADAAKRNYSGTIELWASRVNPALTHWISEKKITAVEAEKIRALSPFNQVSAIFKLESQGIFFAKNLSKSIIYSVAPPGTSQHISMLALDVNEHNNQNVREILANHNWFQTVISDLPHFTFLGISENRLEDVGLKKVFNEKRVFWIPDI